MIDSQKGFSIYYTQNLTPESVSNFLRASVDDNKEIYGSTMSFEPFVVDSSVEYFAPYFYRANNEVKYKDLNDSLYRYYEWEWYKEPKRSKTSYWSEPYFDDGGGNIYMSTYSRPLYKTYKNGTRFIGVVTADLSLDWMHDVMKSVKIYKTGYAFLISSKGQVISHPYISFEKDTSLFNVASKYNDKQLTNVVTHMTAGETGFLHYTSPVSQKSGMLYFTKLKTNGWSMGVFFPENEYMEEFNDLNLAIIIIGIFEFVILLIFIILLSNNITKPLDTAALANESIAKGDIYFAARIIKEFFTKHSKKIDKVKVLIDDVDENRMIKMRNEVYRMIFANKQMADNLIRLIGKVQQSSLDIRSAVNQINVSARELEATATEQASSTTEVAATTKEIARSAEGLNRAMDGANERVYETVSMAETGNQKLKELGSLMNDFVKSTTSFSLNLSLIADKASKISGIVTTISKISEQTNLLSLNAAIEAERAGEYGKGFSIVAHEISRLADQTSNASQDIEFMVKEMQNTVSNGVMKMDKFSKDVFSSVSNVDEIRNHLSNIIDEVSTVSPVFEVVTKEVHYQADSAKQISEAMGQLKTTVEQTKYSLTEFKRATQSLADSITELMQEVSYFKIIE